MIACIGRMKDRCVISLRCVRWLLRPEEIHLMLRSEYLALLMFSPKESLAINYSVNCCLWFSLKAKNEFSCYYCLSGHRSISLLSLFLKWQLNVQPFDSLRKCRSTIEFVYYIGKTSFEIWQNWHFFKSAKPPSLLKIIAQLIRRTWKKC